MILLIAAIDRKKGLAKNGSMPWKIPEDTRYFMLQTKTRGANVLTGNLTFRNAYKGKPLAERTNYILTRHEGPIQGAIAVLDLGGLLKEFKHKDLWVAGGAEVFAAVMSSGRADELYLTHIDADFGCDQFFPEYENDFRLVEQSEPREQNGYRFTHARYIRV